MSPEGEAKRAALWASCLSSVGGQVRAVTVGWVRGERQGCASSGTKMGIQSPGLSPTGGVMLYLVC